MAKLASLCVYCGSSTGADQEHRAAIARLGRELAGRGIRLVYGGGGIGLMGIAADAALAAGGDVVGVIPGHLNSVEVGHAGLRALHVVGGMHARKAKMFELSDAFAILPGGLGTLDEAFEILTWRQLGLHDKPIVLVDLGGYWAPLLGLLDHLAARGFAPPSARDLYVVVDRVEDIFAAVEAAPEARRTAPVELL